MEKSNERFQLLLQKYFDESATEEEIQELWSYLSEEEYRDLAEGLLPDAFKENITPVSGLDEARRSSILKVIFGYESGQAGVYEPKRVRLWSRIAVAAAVAVVMFGVGLFIYKQQQEIKVENMVDGIVDVDPGRLGATLTLADGKKIKLTGAKNGELAKQAGVMITKSADGQLVYEVKERSGVKDQNNILSTANGETYRVRLPDGSQVWLNSASSLSYTASLNESGKRVVSLSGEGYFEVAKDKLHPFVVKTASQEVEVLGTHFNINSYKDEPSVATTLLEGSVKVSGASGEKVLKPGQQALNDSNGIKVAKVDAENMVDWKDGDFYLNHLDFRTAMRKISRWYDVDIMYEKSVPEDLEAGGWISRSTKLSLVLKMIESSGTVKFRVEGRTIYVSKQ